MYMTPIRKVIRDIVEFQYVGNEVTMFKKTEEKMQIYQERLQSLALEMSLIEERERRNIAQVLHDSIGQSLALCIMQLESISSSPDSEESREKIRQIQDTIKSVIKETRSLTSELNPPALYEIGLARAIKHLTEKISKEHNLRIECYEHGKPVHMVSDILGLLFQATRELLVNTIKHAHARKVEIHIRYMETQIQIEVKDDGVGFNQSHSLSNAAKSDSFGLFSISERIQYLGGYVKINSEPGDGTDITLFVPYKMSHRSFIR
jgi:signal transduction histidine kinase